MKSFLYALSESALPSTIFFINSGVLLCAGPDAQIELLARLEEQHWTLKCSEACLDTYSLRDKLKVGRAADMQTIIQGIQSANKVITI